MINNYFNLIPNSVLDDLFCKLEAGELVNLSITSKHFKSLIDNHQVWNEIAKKENLILEKNISIGDLKSRIRLAHNANNNLFRAYFPEVKITNKNLYEESKFWKQNYWHQLTIRMMDYEKFLAT